MYVFLSKSPTPRRTLKGPCECVTESSTYDECSYLISGVATAIVVIGNIVRVMKSTKDSIAISYVNANHGNIEIFFKVAIGKCTQLYDLLLIRMSIMSLLVANIITVRNPRMRTDFKIWWFVDP